MGTVSGTGTTYALPNYHGALFVVSPVDTPFLSAIGGINGAKVVHSKTWEWQTIARRASSANNAALEGQNAPTATNQSRGNVMNITEIHQSAISISYSKMAAIGQFSGVNIAPLEDDVVLDELQLQTEAELQSMGVDIEKSFLSGTLQIPADNTTARHTQGILGAIETNLSNVSGDESTVLAPAMIDSLLQTMYTNAAPLNQETTVLLASAETALWVSYAYAAQSSLSAPIRDQTIAGVAYKTITTTFGTFAVMMDRWMPNNELGIIDLSACYPVFTEVPGKGVLFVEPLAKTGATEQWQLYGEIGLEWGPETYHGLLTGFTAPSAP